MSFNILRQDPATIVSLLHMQYHAHIWDVLCLQEAGALSDTSLLARSAGFGELRIVWSPRYQRAQCWRGARTHSMGVAFDLGDGLRHVFVNVHLPTSNFSDEIDLEAIHDIDELIAAVPRRGRDIVAHIVGDFNVHLAPSPGVVGERVLRRARDTVRTRAVVDLFSRYGLKAANTYNRYCGPGDPVETLLHKPTGTCHMNDYMGLQESYIKTGNYIRTLFLGILTIWY